MSEAQLSRNEIEMLVFKAARGGGLPLGLAEELSAVAAYLDLDALTVCPCRGEMPQMAVLSTALDCLGAGLGPQQVAVDPALMAAFGGWALAQFGQELTVSPDGRLSLVDAGHTDTDTDTAHSLGRRALSPTLKAHLVEMAALTLVPETEASRAHGAGAGLTDND